MSENETNSFEAVYNAGYAAGFEAGLAKAKQEHFEIYQNSIKNKIRIRGKLPSFNEYIDACRTNAHAGAEMKKDVENMIIIQLGKLKPITTPVFVTFTWHEKNRRRDKDNVAVAKKFVFDAMQKAGKLPNDNNKYIHGFADLFEYGVEYGVTIAIQEAKKNDSKRDQGKPEQARPL